MKRGNYPKISIVIHCYNRENYIAETLDSILSQNYPNLELIVIDDGSTDQSWNIITTYKKRLAYTEQLQGFRESPVEALNAGLTRATGEIMGWLNTKNTLLPESLFTIAEIFKQCGDIEWITGVGTVIDGKSKIIKITHLKKNIYDYLIKNRGIIQQESTFWRHSLWEKAGDRLPNKYRWSFDTALWTKFFPRAELYHVDVQLGTYRKVPESTSIASRKVFIDNTFNILDDFHRDTPLRTLLLAQVYRMLRWFRIILRYIPDHIYIHLPILRFFSYPVIHTYKAAEGWGFNETRENPFRDVKIIRL